MRTRGWVADAERLDVATYAAIARTPTPTLDRAMSTLSAAADHSQLWLGASALLVAFGHGSGRRAARDGLASVAATSAVVNLFAKPLGRRHRPAREEHRVPLARHVPMPRSTSFPSGHSASAFAFVTGVARTLPAPALPLRALAGLVAYSRVHTGVHYPGDVVIGALLGASIAQVVTGALDG
jgi:membrane-associated phospholipid phosphatase